MLSLKQILAGTIGLIRDGARSRLLAARIATDRPART